MRNRSEILRKKAQEILGDVSKWAEGELLLESEEYISVALEIKKKVLIVKAPQENRDVLNMPLLDFFTPQRCVDIVADKSLYTRIKNRLTEKSIFWESSYHDKSINLKTVGDLIIFGQSRLFEIQYFGEATVGKINLMLATEGLRLDE